MHIHTLADQSHPHIFVSKKTNTYIHGIHTHTYIHTHIHIHIYAHTRLQINRTLRSFYPRKQIHTYIAHTHTHTHTHTYTLSDQSHPQILDVLEYLVIYIYIYICMYIYIYICTYTLSDQSHSQILDVLEYLVIYIYVYIYMHIHAFRSIAPSDLRRPGVFAKEWIPTSGEQYANYGQVVRNVCAYAMHVCVCV
jgi:hypothetical protein